MSELALAAAFAVFVWWFTTGLIVFLNRRPRATFGTSIVAATAVMLLATLGLAATRNDTTVAGAYAAFICAILVWGHQEICFLMGYITGPRTLPCPPGCSGSRRFGYAVRVILYHELAIVVAAAAVAALTWPGANHVGLWTFLILWVMRLSAKLNLFFGVRNLSEEFLPAHMEYLKGYFTRKAINPLFPIAITASTMAGWALGRAAFVATSAFDAVGYTLLATLMALAVLEHWMMVLPWSPTAMWRWAMRSGSAVGISRLP